MTPLAAMPIWVRPVAIGLSVQLGGVPHKQTSAVSQLIWWLIWPAIVALIAGGGGIWLSRKL